MARKDTAWGSPRRRREEGRALSSGVEARRNARFAPAPPVSHARSARRPATAPLWLRRAAHQRDFLAGLLSRFISQEESLEAKDPWASSRSGDRRSGRRHWRARRPQQGAPAREMPE